MFKKTDPYTFSKYVPLELGGNPIGTLRIEYQVSNYEDVQLRDAGSIADQAVSRQYLVSCSQSINIFNVDGLDLSPSPNLTTYLNYPVLLSAAIEPELNPGIIVELVEYSPQTVNTKIQQSGSVGDSTGKTASVSSNHTIGSSTAETNSYGASVTLSETPSVSATFDHSTTTTSDRSATFGSDSSDTHSRDNSSSASMSVKDWGAYALVNPSVKSVVWTFGQEHPWDAVECRLTNGNQSPGGQTEIVIPTAVQANLFDGVSLYPPSHLATFGINFVMKAIWLVKVDNATTPHSDQVGFDHRINYFSGSHMLLPPGAQPSAQQAHVFMDQQPTVLQPAQGSSMNASLDLGLMALDAVGRGGGSAIIGFIPRKFVVAPAPYSSTAQAIPFEIFASGNNLLIRDTTAPITPAPDGGGFSASQTALTATFTAGVSSLTMTIYFKVLDVDSDYSFYIKHWITGSCGVSLELVVNGDTDHAIRTFAVAAEAEGGEGNLTKIILRNLDFTSVAYSDLLQIGLNSLQLTIAPLTAGADCTYQVRAVSIEND